MKYFLKAIHLLIICSSFLISQVINTAEQASTNTKSINFDFLNLKNKNTHFADSDLINRKNEALSQKSFYESVIFGTEEKKDSILIYDRINSMPKWHSAISNIPNDWARFCKEYISMDYFPEILAISASTAVLIATDDATWKESDKIYNKSQFNKNISDFFTEFGDGRTQFTLAAGFALYGFIGSDNRALKTASQIVEGVLACGMVVQVLKHITGRESPFVATAPGGIWRFFPNQIDYHKYVPHYDAYPSGHIATSVATFVIIQENYPEYKWITPLSCAVSGLICFGMANKGIHWYSDYPLGIALGYAFGKMITNPGKFEEHETESNSTKLKLNPYFGYESIGLKMSFNL